MRTAPSVAFLLPSSPAGRHNPHGEGQSENFYASTAGQATHAFDVAREGPSNLSLATGTHFCTGAGLARLEALVTVERFLARFPNARLVVDPPPVRDDIRPSLRGYAELNVDFGA